MDFDVIGKFTVIMADPPWDIHMELPYGTMTDDEMKKMGIEKVQVYLNELRGFRLPNYSTDRWSSIIDILYVRFYHIFHRMMDLYFCGWLVEQSSLAESYSGFGDMSVSMILFGWKQTNFNGSSEQDEQVTTPL